MHLYATDLDKNEANYQPLSPLTYLERAARVFPEQVAIIHGSQRFNYREYFARCRQLAAALKSLGVAPNETVAVMLANTPPMLEAHFGVPMCRAVLCTLNTRLDAATIAFSLAHSQARVLICDSEFASTAKAALAMMQSPPMVIDYIDYTYDQPDVRVGQYDYETLLSGHAPDDNWQLPIDEWDAISLNYTSGTTGDPKGVVYHHRGAYLLAMGNIVTTAMGQHPVYLWTLPMFHCNGWCFPWTLPVVAGTHVCLRWVRGAAIWQNIRTHKVTHMCGAPIVMRTLLDAHDTDQPLTHKIEFFTAAAPPPESVLAAMASAGIDVTHLYGLTESYGPAVVNAWHQDWDALAQAERAACLARQGVRYPVLEDLTVRDPQTMAETPYDGQTIGEVMFRGNVIMKGYLKSPSATKAAFAGGWFHSGDLAVRHTDGYIQLKDRSKDIIISGGENISSIEIENVLYQHESVVAAAVVAKADDKWGESPCAFVELNADSTLSVSALRVWLRERLAGFKMPKTIVFKELPKTSTGKIQKFKLREIAKTLSDTGD